MRVVVREIWTLFVTLGEALFRTWLGFKLSAVKSIIIRIQPIYFELSVNTPSISTLDTVT